MLIALCVLAAGLATVASPAASQSNSGVRIYDEHPDLYGPSNGWWRVNNPPGQYGLNHHGPYAYTYGNQDASRTNWAKWGWDVPDDRTYDVWVWVPANHATAQVNYVLHLPGCSHQLGVYPTVDQQNYTGWVQIGRLQLDHISNSPSNHPILEVNDNEVGDPNDRLAYRSIGISVALLERDFYLGANWESQINSNQLITDQGCYGPTPTPTPQPPPEAQVDLSEPRNVRATAGDGSLTVSWDAPARTTGLFDYDLQYRCPSSSLWTEWRPDHISSTQRSATITGLANAVVCDIRVWAHSSGQNPTSGGYAHTTGTPVGPPGRVRGLSASGTTVTWSPPASDGGSPITGYGVSYSDGTTGGYIHPNNIGTTTSYTLPAGLSGSVRVTITAHNAAGEGPEATITVNATTVDLSAPRNVRATAGDRSLTVSWDAPARTTGLFDYDVAYRCPSSAPWTEWQPDHISSTQRSATITGLANAVACDIRVWAHSAGQNATSGGYAYATGTPQGTPGPPQNLSVTPGDRHLDVSWSSPADNGGSPITGYRVVWYSWDAGRSGRTSVSGTSHTIRGLTNDATYYVDVYANNRHGPGSKATADGTPMGPPSVRLEVGGNARGPGRCSSVHCKWFDIQLTGSGWRPNGTYRVECGHNGVPGHGAQIWKTISAAAFTDGRNSSACAFGYPNAEAYVIVNGIKSNTVTWPRGTATSPSPPENVSAVARGTRQIRVTWSPPSNTGSAPIRHYVVRYSRPPIGTSPAWAGSATTTRTSHTSGNLRKGATYTITVTAVNQDNRTSTPVTDTVTTTREARPPSQPRNLRATPQGTDSNIRVSWSPPSDTGSAPIRHYVVRYSRPPIGTSPAWSGSATTTSTSHTSGNLRKGVTYTITVTAVNQRNERSNSESVIATTAPLPEVELESRPWYNPLDDPDAYVLWDAIDGAAYYFLDWRYLDANNGGSLVSHNKLGHLVSPGSDPEIRFEVAGGTFEDLRSNTTHVWNSKAPVYKYRIDSNQEQYVLQLRLRAHGYSGTNATYWDSGYSKWVYDPRSVLSSGCKAYHIYNEIKSFLDALNTIDTIVTIASIASAVFTAGSSLTLLAAKKGITEAAKKMVTEMLKKHTIKRFLRTLVQEMIKSAANEAKSQLLDTAAELGVLFACITFATDGNRWQLQHTTQLATDVLTDFMTREKYEQAAIDTVTSALLETLSPDFILEHFSAP